MSRDDKGRFTGDGKLSEYADVYDDYGGWLTAVTDKESTVTRRKEGARTWLAWCEETGHDPFEADDETVNKFIRTMTRDGQAATTISARFVSVSKFYIWMSGDPDYANDISNPTAPINLRKQHDITNNAEYTRVLHQEDREHIIAPAYEELKPLFDHPPGKTDFTQTRNELICRLFWQTALRSDELSRVRLDKTDRDERDIEVRSAKLNYDDHKDLYHRHVYYDESLDYLMYRWLDKRKDADPNCESPYLLIGDQGSQLSAPYLSRVVKRAGHNAGIQEPLVRDADGNVDRWLYTAHRLRHARITYLANKTDMDLNFIRMIAGHASMDTTLTYVDPDWDEVKSSYRDISTP